MARNRLAEGGHARRGQRRQRGRQEGRSEPGSVSGMTTTLRARARITLWAGGSGVDSVRRVELIGCEGGDGCR